MVAGNGATVRVIAGEHGGTKGPVTGIVAEPTLLDVGLEPGAVFEHPAPSERTGFAYVHGGTAAFGMDGEFVGDCHAVRFGTGETVLAEAGPGGGRFLLVGGRPIGEPVAWRGPVVMTTDEEARRGLPRAQGGVVREEARGGPAAGGRRAPREGPARAAPAVVLRVTPPGVRSPGVGIVRAVSPPCRTGPASRAARSRAAYRGERESTVSTSVWTPGACASVCVVIAVYPFSQNEV